MSPQQFVGLLDHIKKNNSWGGNMYDICRVRNRRAVKYVDASFDSRDGSIWRIELRSIVGHEDIAFRVDTADGLAAVYEFLNEPLDAKKGESSENQT